MVAVARARPPARAEITCPAITTSDGNATWPAGAAGNNAVSGTCLPGYTGTPTRPCAGTTTAPGIWGPVVSACIRTFARALAVAVAVAVAVAA